MNQKVELAINGKNLNIVIKTITPMSSISGVGQKSYDKVDIIASYDVDFSAILPQLSKLIVDETKNAQH